MAKTQDKVEEFLETMEMKSTHRRHAISRIMFPTPDELDQTSLVLIEPQGTLSLVLSLFIAAGKYIRVMFKLHQYLISFPSQCSFRISYSCLTIPLRYI